MPKVVAQALGLDCNRTLGSCYSMDGKQVSLVGQIKDVQAILYACPEKRVKLTILVANIPPSYGMLLSRTFCKDMGGEIKMDLSEAIIPIGNKLSWNPSQKISLLFFLLMILKLKFCIMKVILELMLLC